MATTGVFGGLVAWLDTRTALRSLLPRRCASLMVHVGWLVATLQAHRPYSELHALLGYCDTHHRHCEYESAGRVRSHDVVFW